MISSLFSIILPTKNNIRTIGKCLDSIFSQTYPNIEIIFVDNFSTDGTWELANTYKNRLNITLMQIGPERNKQRPAGFLVSKGEVIYFIDSDMYLERNLVAEIMGRFESEKELAGFFIPEENIVESGFWTKAKAFERSFYAPDEPGVSAARIFRRSIYEKAGGFNPNLIAAEDWDLSDKIKKSGAKLSCTKAKVFHDEGIIHLKSLLKKKAYYGEKMTDYAQVNSFSILLQRVYFFRPAFYRGWRKYFSHPILSLGMWIMLTLELFVGAFGVVQSIIFGK